MLIFPAFVLFGIIRIFQSITPRWLHFIYYCYLFAMVPPPSLPHPFFISPLSPDSISVPFQARIGTQAWVSLLRDERTKEKLRRKLGAPVYHEWLYRCLNPAIDGDDDDKVDELDEEITRFLESHPDQGSDVWVFSSSSSCLINQLLAFSVIGILQV